MAIYYAKMATSYAAAPGTDSITATQQVAKAKLDADTAQAGARAAQEALKSARSNAILAGVKASLNEAQSPPLVDAKEAAAKAKESAAKAKEAADEAAAITEAKRKIALEKEKEATSAESSQSADATIKRAAATQAAKEAVQAEQRALAAATEATNAATSSSRTIASLGLDTNLPTNQPPQFQVPLFLLSGAKFQNPYVINYDNSLPGSQATLAKSGNDTVGFLEVAWMGRYALRGDSDYTSEGAPIFGGHLVNPLHTLPDVEGRIGFVFGNSLPSTNYSASTIAGGGDFYASLAFGIPFWRSQTPFARSQINAEFSFGASTDKNFLLIHPTVFLGLSYELGYKLTEKSEVPGAFAFRAGMGLVDNPDIINTPTNSIVRVDSGLPSFEQQWVPSLGVYLAHPLMAGMYVTVGANIYSLRGIYGEHKGPDQWNISVGVSIPFETAAKMLTPATAPGH